MAIQRLETPAIEIDGADLECNTFAGTGLVRCTVTVQIRNEPSATRSHQA